MTTVGIIANPASGRDIRRLVTHATVLDNEEKVNIVRRVLLGLESVGVDRVWIMPESYGIGHNALDGLKTRLDISILSMSTTFTQDDTKRAAEFMVRDGVSCLVTIGGDGTNRAVAKTCADVPLVPISTGTNNAFPSMIEGTIAGIAAGLVARGVAHETVQTMPRLDVFTGVDDDAPDEVALVDAAVYEGHFVAARALLDATRVKEVLLTRAEAGNIGLSAIGAHVHNGSRSPDQGLYLRLELGGQRVLAPIAPGVVINVSVAEHRLLNPGDEVLIERTDPYVLAFDGEREMAGPSGESVRIRLNARGPRVVDAARALEVAASEGVFVESP